MAALTEARVGRGSLRVGIDVLHRVGTRIHSFHSVSEEQTYNDLFIASTAEVKSHPLRETLIDLSLAVGTFIAATIQRNSF